MNALCSSTHGIYTETTRIAEHIQDVLSVCIFLNKGTIVALVHKESRFLSFEPVDMEL